MKAVLPRTGSVPVLPSFVSGSPRVSLSVHDAVGGVFSGEKNRPASPRISLHLDVGRPNDNVPGRRIRRALSDSDVIRLESKVSGGISRLSGVGSRSVPARIPEEEHLSDGDEVAGDAGWSSLLTEGGLDWRNYGGDWPENGIPVEDLGLPGGGIGQGGKSRGGGGSDDSDIGAFTGGQADRNKIGAYYEEMLKSNPTNSLLLRNYGKFLHEVERDTVKAEEYYGRAILASPGDGELLSLYGTLIWETQGDQDRAQSYLDRAVQASPDDCMVLGSYARFMWEAEEEEEEEEEEASPALVAAF